MSLACSIRSSASSISSIDVSTGPIDSLRPSIIDPPSLDWSESICEFIDAKRTSELMRKRCIEPVYALSRNLVELAIDELQPGRLGVIVELDEIRA